MVKKSSIIIFFIGLWLGIRSAKCNFNEAKLWFFWGDNFDNHQIYSLDESLDILKHPEFKINNLTTLYVHGYIETPKVESIHVIVDAYLKKKENNIIILDWSTLADGNYLLDAVINARQLGPKIAEVVQRWFANGLEIQLFHLVGHSLGGQLSGIIGRNIIKQSKKTIILPRISALDPAFPPFYPGLEHISRKDALMVDVIHTDAWLYGAPITTGSIDFWPNGGKTLQPGCPKRNYKLLSDNDLCSHRLSWRYWAESVINSDNESFHSVKAQNWKKFQNGVKDDSLIIQMGFNCVPNVTGDFYLQTNPNLPFSQGIEGITYKSIKDSEETNSMALVK